MTHKKLHILFVVLFLVALNANSSPWSVGATVPVTSFPFVDMRSRTIPVFYGPDGAVVVAATLDIGTYERDVTFATLAEHLNLNNSDAARTSPEGLECLAERYRTNPQPSDKDKQDFLSLYRPEDRRIKANSVLKDDVSTVSPPNRPIHKAVFGRLTEISVAAAVNNPTDPLSDVPGTDFMVEDGGEYSFVELKPQSTGLPTHIFSFLVSNYENSMGFLNRDLAKEDAYKTLVFNPPSEMPPHDKPASTTDNVGESPSFSLSFQITRLSDGPFYDFLRHAIATLGNGNDDQIRKLFDSASPADVTSSFVTTNGRQLLEGLRRDMRTEKLDEAFLIRGSSAQYIIFLMSGSQDATFAATADVPSPSTQMSAKQRGYVLRCSQDSGTISLTGRGQNVSETVEAILNDGVGALMAPSEVCARLIRQCLDTK